MWYMKPYQFLLMRADNFRLVMKHCNIRHPITYPTNKSDVKGGDRDQTMLWVPTAGFLANFSMHF